MVWETVSGGALTPDYLKIKIGFAVINVKKKKIKQRNNIISSSGSKKNCPDSSKDFVQIPTKSRNVFRVAKPFS